MDTIQEDAYSQPEELAESTTIPQETPIEKATEPQLLENSTWGKFIPWFLSITCIVVLAVIGNFLIENVNWFKKTAYEIQLINAQEPVYRIHTYHMHMSMIKNSVGIFSGFAIMFLGLGVAFYSLKKETNVDLKSAAWSANVATASPGIIALLVGGTIIMYSVGNKAQFPPFPIIYEQGAKVQMAPGSDNSTEDKNSGQIEVIESPFGNPDESTESEELEDFEEVTDFGIPR